MSNIKEVHYFNLNYSHSLLWYRRHFPLRFNPNCKQTGEASPCYMIHPKSPERIARTIPDVKLIFILRNPVDRAYSGYHHERRHGREDLTFREAIRAEDERLKGEKKRILDGDLDYSFNHRHYSYLERGKYVKHLQRYLEYFSEDQMFLAESRSLFESAEDFFPDLCNFLEIDPWVPDSLETRNTGNYDDTMSAETRSHLESYFEPYNQKLRERFDIGHDWS